MSTAVTVAGVAHTVPALSDSNWGNYTSLLLIALATPTKVLQTTSTTFTLASGDLNFGATYGLKAAYYKSRATNPSSTGVARFGNAESVGWRNAANNADLLLTSSASDRLTYGGVNVPTISSTDALTNKTIVVASNTITTAASGNLAAVELNAALAELQGSIDTSDTNLSNHLADTIDAHDASAISSVASGNLAATDVQAALNELQSSIDTSDTNLSNHLSDNTDAHDASAISSVASGNLAATDVQAALNELQTDIDTRAPSNSPTLVTPVLGAATGTSLAMGEALPASAILDAASTSKGFLEPRMTQAQRDAISSPATGLQVYNTDTNKLNYYNGSAWKEVGSGSSGVNYITDTDGSVLGSWVTYDDGASSTPVNGIDGSPGITYAISTNTDLRGANNFLFTHDAADRQGEGFSYNFTIDAADKYSVLQCSFDYLVASGTYADDDLQFWIYDVTNSTLIQPAPYKLKNASIAQKFAFEFQATSSTSYRLIGHVATTTATAYTIRFDNWNLGPQAKLYGSPVTDWVAFTPTGSWSSNTTYTGYKRRVGDTEFYRIKVATSGAPTSASLTINLPSTIDTAKLADAGKEILGLATISDSGSVQPGFVNYNTSTSVIIRTTNTASTYADGATVTQAVPFTFGAGDYVVAEFSVPIVGWSSSVVMSSDAATNVVVARYNTAAGQTITNSGGPYIIDFGTKVFDTNGAVTTGASWKYTALLSGKYNIKASILYDGATYAVGNNATLQIYKNGSFYSQSRYQAESAVGIYAQAVHSDIVDMVAGDYIDIRTDNNRTAGNTSLIASAGYNFITVERISGPAQIAASETVAMSAYNGAGTTISTDATIPFATEEYDTHGAWSTDTFTAPISGLYSVQFGLYSNGIALGTGNNFTASILIDGSAKVYFLKEGTASSNNQAVSGSKTFRLLAGQTIKINANFTTGSATLSSTASRNYICITRTGNY